MSRITISEWCAQLEEHADRIGSWFPIYTTSIQSDSLSIRLGRFAQSIDIDLAPKTKRSKHFMVPRVCVALPAANGDISQASIVVLSNQQLLQDFAQIQMMWTNWPESVWVDGECPCDFCGERGESRGSPCEHCDGKGER